MATKKEVQEYYRRLQTLKDVVNKLHIDTETKNVVINLINKRLEEIEEYFLDEISDLLEE